MPVMLPAVHRLFQQPYVIHYSCYENVKHNYCIRSSSIYVVAHTESGQTKCL
jgi:hypothetical protein